jgi:hypothetical protein
VREEDEKTGRGKILSRDAGAGMTIMVKKPAEDWRPGRAEFNAFAFDALVQEKEKNPHEFANIELIADGRLWSWNTVGSRAIDLVQFNSQYRPVNLSPELRVGGSKVGYKLVCPEKSGMLVGSRVLEGGVELQMLGSKEATKTKAVFKKGQEHFVQRELEVWWDAHNRERVRRGKTAKVLSKEAALVWVDELQTGQRTLEKNQEGKPYGMLKFKEYNGLVEPDDMQDAAPGKEGLHRKMTARERAGRSHRDTDSTPSAKALGRRSRGKTSKEERRRLRQKQMARTRKAARKRRKMQLDSDSSSSESSSESSESSSESESESESSEESDDDFLLTKKEKQRTMRTMKKKKQQQHKKPSRAVPRSFLPDVHDIEARYYHDLPKVKTEVKVKQEPEVKVKQEPQPKPNPASDSPVNLVSESDSDNSDLDSPGSETEQMDPPTPRTAAKTAPEYLELINSYAGRYHNRRYLCEGQVGTATLTPAVGQMEGNDGTYTMQLDGATTCATGLTADQLEPYVEAYEAQHRGYDGEAKVERGGEWDGPW